jgi:hypothetical protein
MASRLPTPRASALLAGAFLALAALGPGSASAEAAEITLKASKTKLEPKQSTELSGKLSGTFSSASGKTVTLYATPYPYDDEEVVKTTTTGNGGAFSFKKVDPAINTRYRVAFDGNILDGDATSGNIQIFRFIRDRFELRITRDGYAKGRVDLFYANALKPEYYVGRKDVSWYFGKTSGDRYERVARTRFRDTDKGVASKIRFKLPRAQQGYEFFFFPCVEAPAKDIGIGNKKPVNCPDSIPARAARSAARYAE